MSQANQQAIAERLGLSRATVSRCFTNHAGISPVTRAKVFQVASEIGYTHMENRTSSRKDGKTKTRFSVLICSDPEEYFSGEYESPGVQILAGVSEYGQLHNVGVDVNVIPPNVTDLTAPEFAEIEGLNDRKGRGVLLIYPFPSEVVRQLALRFPLVSLVDQTDHLSIDCVDVDHYGGISSAIDHLYDAGHRRIGFYTRQYPNEASWSFRRHAAYIEKMTRLKLKVATRDVIGMFPRPAMDIPQSIAEAADRSREGVSAWVCAADHQAYDLVRGFKKHGLDVPGDVSVTGFDGIRHAETDPELTTIQVPYRAIGKTGAERVAARLQKRFAGKQHIYIAGELRAGSTAGKTTR